ncbi:hypothetical protein Pla110_42610 [Polystyrenella longa]|uniref:Uncharacterized protein n=1 Tax=Polystyrenella longa TaxID=2528007 RepID=A0A518CTF8_9PLAN|nr:hypothetical protein [Polystyrenella longa]QDU82503.1 hypothetical protein Pla110_42610 [Polystyrenella longa]
MKYSRNSIIVLLILAFPIAITTFIKGCVSLVEKKNIYQDMSTVVQEIINYRNSHGILPDTLNDIPNWPPEHLSKRVDIYYCNTPIQKIVTATYKKGYPAGMAPQMKYAFSKNDTLKDDPGWVSLSFFYDSSGYTKIIPTNEKPPPSELKNTLLKEINMLIKRYQGDDIYNTQKREHYTSKKQELLSTE